MCGIVGVASRVPVNHRDWLRAGCDAMAHRGPDDAGLWWATDGRVGLGHRRLAIVDLSAGGHQPMVDVAANLTIVFNGEIYNYQDLRNELLAKGHCFRSSSDTEVILEAYREWGRDCLARFNGMFAFALYDAERQLVFFARDRAGEKPLFYSVTGGEIRFASELKGLLADSGFGRCIDPAALDMYLSMGYVPGSYCMVRGVNKLPAAHAMIFDLVKGVPRIWRYWQLPEPPPIKELGHDDAPALLEELEPLLEGAISRQLVADVPVGILLSGGVDSSLITALAARASSKIKTFTVGFPNFGKFDESGYASLIARHFNTEHIVLNAGQISPDLLALLARQYDEPLIDSSMIPTYLVSQLVRQHCTVALGGDGGDELFGGYAHYNRLLWTARYLGWLPAKLREVLGCVGKHLPTGFKGRNWLQALGQSGSAELPFVASFLDAAERRQLLGGLTRQSAPPIAEDIWRGRSPDSSDLLQKITRMDFANYMPEDILVKIDRASMRNSLELRAPFLDYRVIEFAFGRVPSELKATVRYRKILLKMLAQRLLPQEFDITRKQGFSIPLGTWLANPLWGDYFNDILLDSSCMFDKKFVRQLLNGQSKGRPNHERLFGLVMFELWRREYNMVL